MALVDHNQIEEVWRELLVDVLLFFAAGHRLIEREIDFVRGIHRAVGDLGHRLAERFEVVVLGLVDQDIAVSEEQNALLLA